MHNRPKRQNRNERYKGLKNDKAWEQNRRYIQAGSSKNRSYFDEHKNLRGEGKKDKVEVKKID